MRPLDSFAFGKPNCQDSVCSLRGWVEGMTEGGFGVLCLSVLHLQDLALDSLVLFF